MNKLKNKIDKIINKKKTLLGVGPMSLNVVDSSIELADKYKSPIMLIASRRQVDSDEFGGGYVNNWTTKNFSNYVKKKEKTKNIYLARDHGGPWQNNLDIEGKISLKSAMISAKNSFEEDIDSGFSFIHIDTSIDIHKKINFRNSMDRLFELYEHCYAYSKRKKKEILFEIGTEEQNGSTNSFEELKETLNSLSNFCQKNRLPKVTFVVIQSGTKVMERKNIGSFESPVRIRNEIPVEIHLIKILEICKEFKVYMKEHNTDYLSNDSLKWHPRLGIHAANVAPEFGVTESLALVNILKKFNLKKHLNKFLELSYDSKKWSKWVIDKNSISDYEKSIISGHYIFAKKEFLELKSDLNFILNKKKINLDNELKKFIKEAILRYLRCFELI
jgi:hypothetical protein